MSESTPRIGAHIRTDKGLEGAFAYAKEWGADVLQIFTASPRQYVSKLYTQDKIDDYLEAWRAAGEPLVISHASYLLNLASPKDDVRHRARGALKQELERCGTLNLTYLVFHMGAALESPREEALQLLVDELNEVMTEVESPTMLLLETSAGQGTTVGTTFEEVGWVLNRLEPVERFGVCLDTCHIFAAGYDLHGAAFDTTFAAFDQHVGFDRLKVMHLNDSKGKVGDCKDRHEHIGEGQIGEEPFRRLFAHPTLRGVPCFIETPDDLENHPRNIAKLKELASA
ncbi:MAG: deoxyribonuclease IV [Candidatus Poribacteria bacterium]|nr:deoxyribonuclease IV [Candidatus Poribacteria bacterium]